MLPDPRNARYSGSDRPAWRMNHTGTRGATSRRQAARNGTVRSSITPVTVLPAQNWPTGEGQRHGSVGLRCVGRSAHSRRSPFMPHPDLAAEQAHVDHAYERLEAMRAAAAEMLHTAFGERGGTFQAVTERDIRVRTSLNRLEQLELGGESLVFGRIDRLP